MSLATIGSAPIFHRMNRWFLPLIVLLACFPLLAVEPFPPVFAELEALALKDPGPGPAFGNLYRIAAQTERLPELRERWAARNDPAGLLLLGWAASTEGKPREALELFAGAAALGTFPAKLAHARALVAIGDAQAEAAAREALAASGTVDERLMAVHLLATRLALQDGPSAGRTFFLEQYRQAPNVGVRLSLMPYAAATALADGTAADWLAELEKANARAEGWSDAAAYATACLIFHDPALAHRVIETAIARGEKEPTLHRLGATAAFRAGFVTAGARHTLALLGEHPTPPEIHDAMERLLENNAANALRELVRRHPAVLAASAARWRHWLPQLRRLGLLADLRLALPAVTRDADWEGHLVLAEAATAEGDFADAQTHFWALLESRAELTQLSSLTVSTGNHGWTDFAALPLANSQFATRLTEIRQFFGQGPMESGDEAASWSIPTLADARDYTIARLVRFAGWDLAEEPFHERLRKAVAKWPAGEKLHAAVIGGSPAMVLERLEAIAAAPAELSAETILYARARLVELTAQPWLDPALARRAAAIRLPSRVAPPEPFVEHAGTRALRVSFHHFLAGDFEQAEASFLAAQPFLRAHSIVQLDTFYNSLLNALGNLPEAKREEGARRILEWMARETATQLDLPKAPDYSLLTAPDSGAPESWTNMFVAPPSVDWPFSTQPISYTRFPGGWVLPEQSAVLYFWALKLPADKRLDLSRTKLTGHALQVLQDYDALRSAWTGNLDDLTKIAARSVPEAKYVAPGLLQFFSSLQHGASDATAPERSLPEVPWPGPIGRGARLVALAHSQPAESLVEDLTKPALTAWQQTAVLNLLEKEFPTSAAKLAKSWALLEGESIEPPDLLLTLRKLTLLAEGDRVAAVAKTMLVDNPNLESLRASASEWFSPLEAALQTLKEIGEFSNVLDDLLKRVQAQPENVKLRWALAKAMHFSVHNPSGLGEAKTPLEKRLSARALPAFLETADWLRTNSRARFTSGQYWEQAWAETDPLRRSEKAVAMLCGPLLQDLSPFDFNLLCDFVSVEDHPTFFARFLKQSIPPRLGYDILSAWKFGQKISAAGLKPEANAWVRRAIRHSSGNLSQFYPTHVLPAANSGDREEVAQSFAELIAERTRPLPVEDSFLQPDPDGAVPSEIQVLPLFEAAQRHGVLDRVCALVAPLPIFGADLALLGRALGGNPKAFAEVEKRLDESSSGPLPNALREDLACALAHLPQGRLLAIRLLASLEDYRTFAHPVSVIPRLARHARAGAQAGSPNSMDWVKIATRRLEALPQIYTSKFAPALLETASRFPGDPIFGRLRDLLAQSPVSQVQGLYPTIYAAAEAGNSALVTALEKTLAKPGENEGFEIWKRRQLPLVRKLLAISSGDLRAGAPVAWVTSGPDAANGGKSTVQWDLGWYWNPWEMGETPAVAGLSKSAAGGDWAAEFFVGRETDRLESLARIDHVGVRGSAALKLPAGAQWLSLCLRSPGQVILGQPRKIIPETSPIPLEEKLTSPFWASSEGGPAGKRYAPATRGRSWNEEHFATLLGVFPVRENEDLVVSGWFYGGRSFIYEFRGADGKALSKNDAWQPANGPGWTWYETRIGPFDKTGPRRGLTGVPSGTVEIAVYLPGDAEISGAWFACTPTPLDRR